MNLLDQYEDGSELPFFLIRLNDWVGLVYSMAHRLLEKRIVAGNEKMLVKYYGLVQKAKNIVRNANTMICEKIDQFLSASPEVGYWLIAESGIRGEARNHLVRNVILRRAMDLQELEKIYRIEPEPFLKLLILKNLLEHDASHHLEYLQSLWKIKSSIQCKLILLGRLSMFGFDSIESMVHGLLFSASVSVRKSARDLYAKHRNMAFLEIYSQALTNLKLQLPCIIGIGETGSKGDALKLKEFLASTQSAIRKQALIAIAKLDVEILGTILLGLLQDEDLSVSCTARKILQKNQARFSLEEIDSLINSSSIQHVRWNSLLILTSSEKWDSIYYILKYLEEPGESAALCERQLQAWNQQYNRSYRQPTEVQITRILTAIGKLEKSRDQKGVQDVVFAVNGFRRTAN